MVRSVWFVSACVGALMTGAVPGHAQPKQQPQWMKCFDSRESADGRIAACTAGLRDNVEGGKMAGALYAGRAVAYLEKKDYERALADHDEVVRETPDFFHAYWSRGQVHAAKGDHASAIADYDFAIQFGVDDPDLYVDRANALIAIKNYDRAIEDCSSALELKPDHAEAFANRGFASAMKRDYVRAATDYEQAIKLDPKAFSLHDTRGFANFLIGNFAAARESFVRAAAEKPSETYYAIWTYLADSRAGGKEAAGRLRADAARLDRAAWPYPVIELYLGAQTAQAVLAAASTADERCEAQFYIGQKLLLESAPEDARAQFRIAAETCPKTFYEYDGAVADLKRLEK
jgi:lipoprotein NlpI